MNKLKRILALMGVLLILLLFCALIILAVSGAPAEQLMAVFFAIVFLSVVLYAIGLTARVFGRRDDKKDRS